MQPLEMEVKCLVCSDIVARGIDIPAVSAALLELDLLPPSAYTLNSSFHLLFHYPNI